ncbi:methyltransferase [Allokutzneria albata]|uniref:methyltransferase n=1 Tax=Allokutzneria albata TaxID=211114 RepID=UPI0004C37A37|nr:methyltransferase [Allokutzneria albata]
MADRCTLVPGDFTESVPANGDVYLLLRIPHDWDDAQCHAILATCAANMPEHAELLVIERPFPETADTDSLAVPWDVHMLCNVGGRERTASQYCALLTKAGFEVTGSHSLSLDAYVLRARARTSGPRSSTSALVGAADGLSRAWPTSAT